MFEFIWNVVTILWHFRFILTPIVLFIWMLSWMCTHMPKTAIFILAFLNGLMGGRYYRRW